MKNHGCKPAYYDLPLYMRIFPFLKNEEYICKSKQKRDSFEDFLVLYSIFTAFGFINSPSYWQGGCYRL